MSSDSPLSIANVRAYVQDYAPNNYLVDGEEFEDDFIELCMDLAVDEYNSMVPLSKVNLKMFPSKSVLLQGTLWKMFQGKAALLARNTMNYSDGGLQIPIEERAELYLNLANIFYTQFRQNAERIKVQFNMESGWGGVIGDATMFPTW